jgi:hypothetical protein
LAVVLGGCSDDDPARPTNHSSPYKDLSQEWHVLYNLELSWDEMDVEQCDSLLDADNFTFYPDPGDVGKDGVPAQWGYAAEMEAVGNMFTQAGGTRDNPITSIDVTLFDIDEAEWQDATDDDFPGETLRQTTVEYAFVMDTADGLILLTSTITPSARFIVRKVGSKWKLVEWYDLVQQVSTATRQQDPPELTEEISWARVKALYR